MDNTLETVKLLYSTHAILPLSKYRLHSFKYEEARLWNKLDLSFKFSGSVQQFNDFQLCLCYCTAELLLSHGRPSSCSPSSVKTVSQNPSSRLMPHLVERYLFSISP